jgi:gluconokinase
MIVILMGVSGSGKTTIGLRLSGDLGWRFLDADDFVAPANTAANIPPDSAGYARPAGQREQPSDGALEPGLAALRAEMAALATSGEDAILACSALTAGNRRLLTVDPQLVRFVYLKGSAGMIRRRLRNRSGHYLGEQTLASQLAAFEEPIEVITIDIDERPGRIVEQIRQALAI